MNKTDSLLLGSLQKDSRQSIAALAERCAMSTSACHRRMRQLEEQGVIAGYGARLDPEKLGLNLHAFVEISLVSQTREAMDAFEAAVARFDDILECHLMSGSADYLLRVAASDLADFDHIHRNYLARLPGVAAMKSAFAIRRIKRWEGYPVHRGGTG